MKKAHSFLPYFCFLLFLLLLAEPFYFRREKAALLESFEDEKAALLESFEDEKATLAENYEYSLLDQEGIGWVHGFVYAYEEFYNVSDQFTAVDASLIPGLDASLFPASPGVVLSPLDSLSRPGPAYALLDQSILPSAPRSALHGKNPVGYHAIQFDSIPSGGWLYNRTHLIGSLFGGPDSPENLITCTQFLNQVLMYPLENQVYTRLTAIPIPIRLAVIPLYLGDELLPRGLYFYAQSASGDDFSISMYLPNLQPAIQLNFADGSAEPMFPAEE